MLLIPETMADLKVFQREYNLLILNNKDLYEKEIKELSVYIRNTIAINDYNKEDGVEDIIKKTISLPYNRNINKKEAEIICKFVKKHYFI